MTIAKCKLLCNKDELSRITDIERDISYRVKDLLEIAGAHKKASFEAKCLIENLKINLCWDVENSPESDVTTNYVQTFKLRLIEELTIFVNFCLKEEQREYFLKQIGDYITLIDGVEIENLPIGKIE